MVLAEEGEGGEQNQHDGEEEDDYGDHEEDEVDPRHEFFKRLERIKIIEAKIRYMLEKDTLEECESERDKERDLLIKWFSRSNCSTSVALRRYYKWVHPCVYPPSLMEEEEEEQEERRQAATTIMGIMGKKRCLWRESSQFHLAFALFVHAKAGESIPFTAVVAFLYTRLKIRRKLNSSSSPLRNFAVEVAVVLPEQEEHFPKLRLLYTNFNNHYVLKLEDIMFAKESNLDDGEDFDELVIKIKNASIHFPQFMKAWKVWDKFVPAAKEIWKSRGRDVLLEEEVGEVGGHGGGAGIKAEEGDEVDNDEQGGSSSHQQEIREAALPPSGEDEWWLGGAARREGEGRMEEEQDYMSLLTEYFFAGGPRDIIKRSKDFTAEQFEVKILAEYNRLIADCPPCSISPDDRAGGEDDVPHEKTNNAESTTTGATTTPAKSIHRVHHKKKKTTSKKQRPRGGKKK